MLEDLMAPSYLEPSIEEPLLAPLKFVVLFE